VGEWRQVRIGGFLSERKGKFKPGADAIEGLQRVDKINFSGNIHLSNKDSKTDLIMVYPGDLLISGINVAKGAVAVYHGESPVVASIHYSSYTFDENLVSIEYFRRFVRSPLFDEILKEQVRGGIKTEIKAKDFLPLQIHLPDIETQNEIVAKFEKIENEISDIASEANHQANLIKQLRQGVLQEAVEGKLTADWRRQHPLVKGDPQHDAAALLAQIKAKKERLIKAGKIRKEKPLPPIADSDKPFELPSGWAWCRLGEIAEGLCYGTSQKCDYDSKRSAKVLRIPNVSSGIIDVEDLKFADLPTNELNDLALQDKDVLIIRSNGSRELVGRMVIASSKHEGYAYAGYLIRLRFTEKSALPTYIQKCSASSLVRDQIEIPLRTTVGINNINTTEISALKFPLPPLAEQQAIVARVDSLMATIDALEAQVTERKEQAQQLMQAVLREAFAGDSTHGN
jgi:type I restriction enzyme S subunit